MRFQSFSQTAAYLAALALGGLSSACRHPAEAPPPPQAVRVAAAGAAADGRALRLSGTIEAERSTGLGFAVPGTVEQVLVPEGATVARGQVLARLDARGFRDAVRIAQAKLDQAQDAHRRLEPMHQNGTVPEVRWIEVETGLEQARAALSMAQKNVDDAALRAPEAGVISRRSVEPGATAVPGLPAFTLIQSRVVLATAPVPEKEVGGVRAGQPARVNVAALGRTFEGKVREIGVAADPLTRTYPVKVAVENADGALRVGMVADVVLQQPAREPLVTVPAEAVRLDDEGRPCVYALDGEAVLHRRRVAVSGYAGELLALASGVAAGDRVVVSGSPMLADGMKVTVLDAAGGK